MKKALYGLRQAPRAWFDKLKRFLVSIGFVVSKSNASLFIRITSEFVLYVLVYVDDIIITGSDSSIIVNFVDQLNAEFALKDMGDLNYFLGVEVTRSSSGSLHLCQTKYIRDLLARSSLSNAKPITTPMVSSSRLSKSDGDPLSDPTEYRSHAGALQYVVLTRPDIAYAVNRICQFMHSPTTVHLIALKRILRYLCGTLGYGIVFRPSTRLSLVGYADANWGWILMIVDPPLATVCILVIRLSFGVPRSSKSSLVLRLKRNTGVLPSLLVMSLGCSPCSKSYRSLLLILLPSGMIVLMQLQLLPILFFTLSSSMWNLICFLFVRRLLLVLLLLVKYLPVMK